MRFEIIMIKDLVPATEGDLNNLKSIIYLIYNTINEKSYIGKCQDSFSKRYSKKLWWSKTTSIYLKEDVLKHGIENFKVFILEHSLKDQYEQKVKEDLYIEKFNCVYPNGYNTIKETQETQTIRKSLDKFDLKIKDKKFIVTNIENGAVQECSDLNSIKTNFKIKPCLSKINCNISQESSRKIDRICEVNRYTRAEFNRRAITMLLSYYNDNGQKNLNFIKLIK
jgi:group I intron endonuclease